MTCARSVATFDVSPEFDLEEISRHRGYQTPAEEGFSMRRTEWAAELRSWRLVWREGTDGQARRLRELWDLTKGSTLVMGFTPPGGSEACVRFVEGSLSLRRFAPNRYEMVVELEEDR